MSRLDGLSPLPPVILVVFHRHLDFAAGVYCVVLFLAVVAAVAAELVSVVSFSQLCCRLRYFFRNDTNFDSSDENHDTYRCQQSPTVDVVVVVVAAALDDDDGDDDVEVEDKDAHY